MREGESWTHSERRYGNLPYRAPESVALKSPDLSAHMYLCSTEMVHEQYCVAETRHSATSVGAMRRFLGFGSAFAAAGAGAEAELAKAAIGATGAAGAGADAAAPAAADVDVDADADAGGAGLVDSIWRPRAAATPDGCSAWARRLGCDA